MSESNGTIAESCATGRPTTCNGDQLSSRATQAHDRILVCCPSCNAILSVRRKYIGKAVRCKRCSQKLLVPETAGTQPMPIYDGALDDPPSQSEEADLSIPCQRSGTANHKLLNHILQFVTSFDELRSEHDELQSKLAELQADRNRISAQLNRSIDELHAIRAELGAIAPSDVQSIASERESFALEVHRLRDEKRALRADKSSCDDRIAQLNHQILGLVSIRDERDNLAIEVERRECELTSVRAEHDTSARRLAEESLALAAAQFDLGQLRQQLQQCQSDLDAACHEREQARGELDLRTKELASVQTDVQSLMIEQRDAQSKIEHLRKTIVDRDQTIATELAQFTAQIRRAREALAETEQKSRAECESLKSQLANLLARHRDECETHQSAKTLCADLQARNQALVAMQERLAAENQGQLETVHCERQKLVDQVHELLADHEEVSRVAEELISMVRSQPTVRVASTSELDAARAQAEDLTSEPARSDYLSRLVAQANDSIGIQVKFTKNS